MPLLKRGAKAKSKEETLADKKKARLQEKGQLSAHEMDDVFLELTGKDKREARLQKVTDFYRLQKGVRPLKYEQAKHLETSIRSLKAGQSTFEFECQRLGYSGIVEGRHSKAIDALRAAADIGEKVKKKTKGQSTDLLVHPVVREKKKKGRWRRRH
jgi:hypothetical protein